MYQDLKRIRSEDQLEEALSHPYPEDVALCRGLEGDVCVLGAGGKMGPSLIRRLLRALERAESRTDVYAVSRFRRDDVAKELEEAGAKIIPADLMDDSKLQKLPRTANLIYLVGQKFGTHGEPSLTWALNSYLPGRVAEHFAGSRIVALSTGNVYPLTPVEEEGPGEEVSPRPIGEYAQSCLGRERVFEYFAVKNRSPLILIRLNYAVEARYGVLVDIARKVVAGEAIDLSMGYVNLIWQGDANSYCLRALELASLPAKKLNVTGPKLRVRTLACKFGELFQIKPRFEGTEGKTALLSDASLCRKLLGDPRISIDSVIRLVARWVQEKKSLYELPTKFEKRDGEF